jgi:hypothetical protein
MEDEIATWIDQARVFLGLVTPRYLDSEFCMGELDKFIRGLDSMKPQKVSGKKQKVPMLALYDSPDIDNDDLMNKCKNRFQLLEIRDEHFESDLDKLVSAIKKHLKDDEE